MSLDDYTVAELKERAKKRGCIGYSKLRKNELVQFLHSGRKHVKNSPKRSRSRSPGVRRSGSKKSLFNSFFSKIYIINLKGKEKRYKKVSTRLNNKGIKHTRFEAVDGRCKDKRECREKKRILEKKYNVKISPKINTPAASLTIGTIRILRDAVKKKWKHVLICEDDITLARNINQRFEQGIRELKDSGINWDLLYLGCGSFCGYRGISEDRTSSNKYKTSLNIVSEDFDHYVKYKNDLRIVCDEEDCERISKNLSFASSPGGTWCYAYSLAGAKKVLKLFNNSVNDHIDQQIIKLVEKGKITAVAFDPPIVFHEAGAFRPDSDIPWNW